VYLKHLISRSLVNKAYEADIRGRLTRPLETVETHLAKRTFLVGERLSLADISAATVLRTAYSFLLGKAERAKSPHTFRFYETVINQPKIKDILLGGPLAETPQQYLPLPKVPSAEPGTRQEPGSEEDRPVTEEKKKNPLDELSKSSFNLEDWKRAYSNLDARGVGGSLEWFYEK
jgi:elongation factor 1-gamma